MLIAINIAEYVM